MTPKEKADDLFVKYYERLPDDIYSNEGAKSEAKQYALIAVNEIIKQYTTQLVQLKLNSIIGYWQEVKQEIQKL